jgi:hypothetical protein
MIVQVALLENDEKHWRKFLMVCQFLISLGLRFSKIEEFTGFDKIWWFPLDSQKFKNLSARFRDSKSRDFFRKKCFLLLDSHKFENLALDSQKTENLRQIR